MDENIRFTHRHLVERCKHGDRKSQKELFELYVDAMYNIALRMMDSKEEAEDMVQEGFTDAFRYLPSFKYESSFGAWLKRIVINKCINQLKTKKIKWVSYAEIPGHYAEKEEEMVDLVDIAKVVKGISMLPNGYRQIFSLYLIEGYDHDEISEILGISTSTSKSQYHRAKKSLMKIIKQI